MWLPRPLRRLYWLAVDAAAYALVAPSLNSGTSRRYTLTLTAIGRNITNHVNVAPLVGNLSSPLFGEANALAGGAFGSAAAGAANRKIDFQAVFAF